jgi:hypothetical protein
MAKRAASKSGATSPKTKKAAAKKSAAKMSPGKPQTGCCTIDVGGKDEAHDGLTQAECKRIAGDNPWHWKAGPCFAT